MALAPRADDETGRASGSRTATTTAATRGASSATRVTTDVAPAPMAAGRRPHHREGPADHEHGPAAAARGRPAPPPARSALHRQAARARRLHRPALVLLGLRQRRPAARAARRAAAGRGGVGVPRRRRRGRRRARAARTDRSLVRLGHEVPRPVPRRRHRGRACCRHGPHGTPARAHRPAAHRCDGPHARRAAYAAELGRYGATLAFTRADVGDRPAGAFTTEELAPLLEGVDLGYVCGSARFASYAEDLLVACGLDPAAIRVERFGPTGD